MGFQAIFIILIDSILIGLYDYWVISLFSNFNTTVCLFKIIAYSSGLSRSFYPLLWSKCAFFKWNTPINDAIVTIRMSAKKGLDKSVLPNHWPVKFTKINVAANRMFSHFK